MSRCLPVIGGVPEVRSLESDQRLTAMNEHLQAKLSEQEAHCVTHCVTHCSSQGTEMNAKVMERLESWRSHVVIVCFVFN